MSSPSRRTKDLATVLFGEGGAQPLSYSPEVPDAAEDEDEVVEPTVEPMSSFDAEESHVVDTLEPDEDAEATPISYPISPASTITSPIQQRPASPLVYRQPEEMTPQTPTVMVSAPPRDIMKEVQEKTEAAMAQLRKSPSYTKLPVSTAQPTKRRIQVQDISRPTLLQSSTSIDKISSIIPSPPLVSPLRRTSTLRNGAYGAQKNDRM